MAKKLKTATVHTHSDHSINVKKLNRVIGQLQGIQRMISDKRYCSDILIQTRAASAAMRAVEIDILRRHLLHCVRGALTSKNETEIKTKTDELVSLINRF